MHATLFDGLNRKVFFPFWVTDQDFVKTTDFWLASSTQKTKRSCFFHLVVWHNIKNEYIGVMVYCCSLIVLLGYQIHISQLLFFHSA